MNARMQAPCSPSPTPSQPIAGSVRPQGKTVNFEFLREFRLFRSVPSELR